MSSFDPITNILGAFKSVEDTPFVLNLVAQDLRTAMCVRMYTN